jgi:hypothetical protein
MTRYSIPAVLALALCLATGVALLAIGPAPARAQAAGACPKTLGGQTTQLTCTCAGSGGGTVWGTDFYTDDSDLCAAAVHAGAIPASGGTVTVLAEPGLESYAGSSRNGVSTSDYGKWSRTILFDFAGTYSNVPACPATYNANGNSWAGVCRCANAGSGTVWGNAIYTADSDLCRAARHAGAIGPSGGVVRVTPWPGLDSYAGTTRNGVTTNSWGSYSYSFKVRR